MRVLVVYAGPRRLAMALAVAVTPTLCGCTTPKAWFRPGGIIGSNFERSIGGQPSPWQVDLKNCVAERDPERLNELNTPESYRLNEWFLSSHREDVMDCLRQKGWREASILYML